MYKINENLLEVAYLQRGTIGSNIIDNVPIVNFSIAVSKDHDVVSGIVEIKHAIDKPSIKLNVAGTIRYVAYESICKVIDLEGEYMVSFSESALGSYSQRFTAHLNISDEGKGNGSFTFGNKSIHNVLITS